MKQLTLILLVAILLSCHTEKRYFFDHKITINSLDKISGICFLNISSNDKKTEKLVLNMTHSWFNNKLNADVILKNLELSPFDFKFEKIGFDEFKNDNQENFILNVNVQTPNDPTVINSFKDDGILNFVKITFEIFNLKNETKVYAREVKSFINSSENWNEVTLSQELLSDELIIQELIKKSYLTVLESL